MKKKVGFFGGTFDPIHFGHIGLAIELSEFHQLDEVLFCPAYCSPFKQPQPPLASGEHRYEMVRLAIRNIPQFRVTAIEIEKREPSYTIDTLRHLQNDTTQFFLLLSEESALHIALWKEASELIRLAPPLIGTRKGASPFLKDAKMRAGITPTRTLDISSTQIRERCAKGLYCGHLLPSEALDYIASRKLYLFKAPPP